MSFQPTQQFLLLLLHTNIITVTAISTVTITLLLYYFTITVTITFTTGPFEFSTNAAISCDLDPSKTTKRDISMIKELYWDPCFSTESETVLYDKVTYILYICI